jgi:hypothetical protein
MFYPILLSMIAATAVGAPVHDPDPTIRITLNNEGQYLPGDRAKVQVITRDDGYLVVFQVNPEGRLRVLFPLDPTDDNYVKGGKRYLLLGRGGREGFTVDAGGTGVVFAAVSLAPWRYTGYVQNDHWDYAALNTVTYDNTETDLVNLAQAMASGRFDYDILGYTVASQVAAAEDPVVVSNDVGMVDSCFGCAGTTVSVIYGSGYYGSGYYNSWGLYDPWYYSPYYNYGPYYPAWAYGPTGGWGWGWGCYGYYCNGGNYGYYYPPYATAVPYTPYQKKGWDRTWNGSPPPYRPRDSYAATNTVSGQLPGVGVQQHASFRDRTWSGATGGGAVAGSSTLKPSAVPVSRGASPAATGGRRRQPAPTMTGSSGSSASSGAPMAVPSRPRVQTSTAVQGGVAPATSRSASGRQVGAPEARPARPLGQRPAAAPVTATPSDNRRYQMPVEWTRPSPAPAPPVSRSASEAPAGTKAVGEGRSAAPVLKRRDPDQSPAPTAPAAAQAQRQDNNGQGGRSTDRTPGRGYNAPPPPPSSQPSPGYSGGGSFGGSSGRAAPAQPSAPPSAVSGGGGRRR